MRRATATIRQWDSNGWQDVPPRCDIDGCTNVAIWIDTNDDGEFDVEVYLCTEHAWS